MTVIAALVAGDGTVWMGGDRWATCYSDAHIQMAHMKLIQHGRMLIGAAGSLRENSLLRMLDMPVQPEGEEDLEYMLGLAEHIKAHFKVHECFMYRREMFGEQETMPGGDGILIGYKGMLYSIDAVYSVLQTKGPIARGAASSFALGAMHALIRATTFTGEQIIRASLEVTAKIDGNIRPPFDVRSVK